MEKRTLAGYLAGLETAINERETSVVYGVVTSTQPVRILYGNITLESDFLLIMDGVALEIGKEVPLLKTNRSQKYLILQSPDIDSMTSPESILAKIKTVDGHGSELDADTLDGKHASAFADVNNVYTKSEVYNKTEVYNKSETYQKSEVYSKGEVYPRSDVFTKDESDSRFKAYDEAHLVGDWISGSILTYAENVETGRVFNIFTQGTTTDLPTSGTVYSSGLVFARTTTIRQIMMFDRLTGDIYSNVYSGSVWGGWNKVGDISSFPWSGITGTPDFARRDTSNTFTQPNVFNDYTNFNSEIYLNDRSMYITAPSTTGGWARGLSLRTPDKNTYATVGIYGAGETVHYAWFGGAYGASNNLRWDATNGLRSGSNTIWHSGNNTSSVASNGYVRLQNGLIIQWGYTSIPANSSSGATVTWPISFPSAVYSVVGQCSGQFDIHAQVLGATKTGGLAYARSFNTGTFAHYSVWVYWIAIGR